MPTLHKLSDIAMDASTGISAMGAYTPKKKRINQWLDLDDAPIELCGDVLSVNNEPEDANTLEDKPDEMAGAGTLPVALQQVQDPLHGQQLEEQPSRLHHTLLGLASRGLIRRDLLWRLLVLEGKQASRDEAGRVRGSSSSSLSTTPK